jgi:probable rRNA maturation factor
VKRAGSVKRKVAAARRWVVHLSVESKKLQISAADIRKLVRAALEHVESEVRIPEVHEISVTFINDARMRDINFEFRGKDKPTDVLSFPQFQPKEISGRVKAPVAGGSSLGDLVISTETTLRQAKEFGVTKRAELVRLVVHGILHLCGYDHEKVPAREAQAMRRRERVMRAALGVR